MPSTSIGPDEVAAASSVWKIVSATMGAALIGMFGWIWRTDRAVQRMLILEEDRIQWRNELLQWMQRLDAQVRELKEAHVVRMAIEQDRKDNVHHERIH